MMRHSGSWLGALAARVRHPTFLGVLLAIPPVAAGNAAAMQSAPFADCRPAPADSTIRAVLTTTFIPMSDGVRLAADIALPAPRAPGTRLPTVLTATRYWRGVEGSGPSREASEWARRGYASVIVDVRGTGASFGTWKYPWSHAEVRDLGDVVRWISSQPWSDGNVGAIGTSYTANTAQLAAATAGKPLKAVIPRFMDFDVWADLISPGGLTNEFMIREWGKAIAAMDRNNGGSQSRGIRPVNGDSGRTLLAAAIRDHEANPPLHEVAAGLVYRDQVVSEWAASSEEYNTFRWNQPIDRARVPVMGWASWYDAGTANGALSRWMTWRTPQYLVIGPWSHGGEHHASPFLPPETPTDPPSDRQQAASACWFDRWLKDRQTGPAPGTISYYTVGEERWKTTTRWPLEETRMERWYFRSQSTLTPTQPQNSESDTYEVDFQATTGTKNRWYTQLGGGDVVYPDRAEADRRLLTYTSAPLERDVEVTGNPVVTLRLATSAADGAFFVYLEDVAPDGRVTYVTEGQLRGIHRLVTASPYRVLYPYHSFRERDAAPMTPGALSELRFGLLPVSVLFQRGHRIRIALAGADKDTFARVPAEGPVTWRVSRTASAPSYIDLPVVSREPR
jgi:hypothetical protein